MTDVDLDLDLDGPAAPPRRNGELVFAEPWHARAFGICVTVLEREGLGWADFRAHLVPAIAADPEGEYYDAFALALERWLAERGVTG